MTTEHKSAVILVVDDEAALRRSLRVHLEDNGFAVVEAENGRVGLERFQACAIDMVLTDLRMPEIDGLEMVKALRRISPDTPVVVVSGTGILQDAIEAIREGAWDYVTKPIEDMAVLDHVMRQAMERARLVLENREYQARIEALLEEKSRALRESEGELETVYAHAPVLLALLDRDLRVCKANYDGLGMARALPPGAQIDMCNLLQCREASEGPRRFQEHPACMDCILRKSVREACKGGVKLTGSEWSFRAGVSNREVYTRISVVPLRALGEDAALLCLDDITGQKQLEAQFRHAQKMEAVGQLAGGIAHDFNNLLQAITGFTHLALEDVHPDSGVAAELEQVLEASGRAATLVKQLLAFSRSQVLELRRVDLRLVVDGMGLMIDRLIGEHIQLEVRLAPEPCVVFGDTGQLEQIIMNLCVNARDAMPAGGAIAITVGCAVRDAAYCQPASGVSPGKFVYVSVSDTGCGMTPDVAAQVFEPFFTTKEKDKGTGLGLAMVYGIVCQHKGMIHLETAPGGGTKFCIDFPAALGDADAQEGRKCGEVQGGRETVLLAEDNTAVRNVTRMFLERAGYTVITAEDGEQAIESFEAGQARFDLVVLDSVMPKTSGRAVYDYIRQRRPELPVLFVSGYNAAEIHTDFVLNSGLEFIQKPFTKDVLLQRIRSLLDA
ncbi:MAG: response regulator [Candidatus Hydrogenedentes bacterium]|nr:response regulator [Candidatus Hydrogenedentota bacterium]